jgi:pimeloyl-ACP methyl ester carboxylesterase
MTRFVLVPGAWHGGWVWQRLRTILEARGNSVVTPTLTGLGDLAHLATPETGLEDHVQDIVEVLTTAAHGATFLVAHSYAGIPATVAADRVPQRLSGIIYLDAQVPHNGQRGFDAWPGAEAVYREASRLRGHGWLIPPPPDETFGIRSVRDLDWVRRQLTPHPLKTFDDRVALIHRRAPVSAGAIVCTADQSGNAIATDGMPTLRIDAGHDAMVSEPGLLANTLLEMTARLSTQPPPTPSL